MMCMRRGARLLKRRSLLAVAGLAALSSESWTTSMVVVTFFAALKLTVTAPFEAPDPVARYAHTSYLPLASNTWLVTGAGVPLIAVPTIELMPRLPVDC